MLLESIAVDDIFGLKKLAGQLKYQAGCMKYFGGAFIKTNKIETTHNHSLDLTSQIL